MSEAGCAALRTGLLLTLSNVFMTLPGTRTCAICNTSRGLVAALVSWGIALFEYLLQVPANRLGYGPLSLAQLR